MSEQDLQINTQITIPGWELWVTTSRSGGAGGQHVNKTETRVTLHWAIVSTTALQSDERARLKRRLKSYINDDGVLQIHASDTRSQYRNREAARERLVYLVRKGLQRRKRRIATKPTRASQRRRVDDKRHRGTVKKLRKPPTRDD